MLSYSSIHYRPEISKNAPIGYRQFREKPIHLGNSGSSKVSFLQDFSEPLVKQTVIVTQPRGTNV